MKFTLTYDGPLPSSGNKPKNDAKWAIRKQFHPQLVDLWASHQGLLGANKSGEFPVSGAILISGHHTREGQPLRIPYVPNPLKPGEVWETIDLNAPIEKHGRKFRPLVRDSYALHCGLKIGFLRKEPPGRVYQGGDIDGRIKTLLDALAMPQNVEQVLPDADAPDPLYCLLEDDSMVSGLQVESERLLGGDNLQKDYAKLTIEVEVRVRAATIYNQSFLG